MVYRLNIIIIESSDLRPNLVICIVGLAQSDLLDLLEWISEGGYRYPYYAQFNGNFPT